MRKTILSLALALLAAAPGLVRALEVPKGKAAVVEAVLGKVSVTQGKKERTAKVGQALDFGDTLSTGANGRLSLRHADNAVTRLAPNTELTLKAPGERKGVFLGLSKGFIRFLVGKRAPGESFEVQTPNAVAAVKGTDAGVETDGKTTKSSVYQSERKKAMEVVDSQRGQRQELEPGQTTEVDEDGFKTRELTSEEREQVREVFQGLPEPQLIEKEQGGKEGEGQEQGQGGEQTQEGTTEEQHDAMVEDINDAFADVMDELQLDSFLERDDRTGDLYAGRIVYDRNGHQAQVSAYIVRPADAPEKVVKANYTKRTSGPFAGTTFAEEVTTWNTALPTDWYNVVDRALDDPANLDGNGYPLYFRKSQFFQAGNPQRDLLQIVSTYGDPLYSAVFNGVGYDPGNIYTEQSISRDLYANGVLLFSYVNSIYTLTDPGYPGLTMADYSSIQSAWNTNTYATADGGVGIVLDDYSSSFLAAEFRVLENDGYMYDLSSMAAGNVMFQDFKGLDSSLNLELTLDAPGFSAPIDLMMVPEVFDAMDILALPVPTYNNF